MCAPSIPPHTIVQPSSTGGTALAAHLVEHVGKFGTGHLEPCEHDLYFYQILMIDLYIVFGILLVGIVIVGHLLWFASPPPPSLFSFF
jgi:hypothetical protein